MMAEKVEEKPAENAMADKVQEKLGSSFILNDQHMAEKEKLRGEKVLLEEKLYHAN